MTNEEDIRKEKNETLSQGLISLFCMALYASGALVKCRKVGKNWGNKSKTKRRSQYLNTEDYQRIQEYGNVPTL